VTTIRIEGVGTLRTTAKRPYLVVTRYQGSRLTVDSSHMLPGAAQCVARTNKRDWPHADWYAVETATGAVL
jgi:hypothetical protein